MLFMDGSNPLLYRVTLTLMTLCDVFLGLGEQNFEGLLRTISMGKLRTYQLFDRLKMRAHLSKLSSETLRRASPRLWARMGEGNEDFATDISQAALVSHLEMIQGVLNFLGIPHEDGFFPKDADVSSYLTEGWQERVWQQFRGTSPAPALLFYINHLDWEVRKAESVYIPS
ncbi:MAG TPA: hypothetical protein VM120_09155, partial [Bryobacteraceae bacterium]|nr:hypothetical protein [Bryobacteraceae bacterium]